MKQELVLKEKLPEGWKIKPLGKISEVMAGFSWTSSDYASKGIPIIRIQNLGNNSREVFVYWEKEYDEKYLVKKGDILLSLSGTIPVSFKIKIWDREEALLNQRILKISITDKEVDPNYLVYLVDYKLNKIYGEASGSTGISNVKMGVIHNLPILLPPLPVQKQIVSKLDAQMAQIEIMKKEAEKIIDAGLYSLKVGLKRIFDSANINEDDYKELGKITKLTSGMTPLRSNSEFYKGDIPWIQTGELQNNLIYDSREKITTKALKETSLKLNPIETLLVAMYGQGKTRGMTGLVKIEATTNQACCAIYPNYNIFIPEYLQIWLIYNYETLRQISEGRGGNQPNLNGQVMKTLKVPFPCKKIQEDIIRKYHILLNIDNEIKTETQSQINAINQLPSSLLNEVFGKYDLPEVK